MTVTGDQGAQPAPGQKTDGPSGLGGWLILPAIGLITTPLQILPYLLGELLPVFQDGKWEAATTPGSEAYHPLWAPLILFEVVGNLLIVACAVLLIVLFFTKSHRFPPIMIGYLLGTLAFVFVDYLLFGLIFSPSNVFEPEDLREIARGIISTMVWVPYFLVSRRVKNTFVKPGASRQMIEAFD